MVPRVLLILLPPFVLALAALLAPGRWGAWRGRMALLAPALVLAGGISVWPDVAGGAVLQLDFPWISGLGIDLGLRVDRLGAFFAVLIGAIGLGIFQYARKYLGPKADAGFWALMLAFTGAMLGIVLSDNLVVLYVFWELTTLTSALLVARSSDEDAARKGALQAFLITGAGGLAMLGGIVLLGQQTGTYSLAALTPLADAIVRRPEHQIPLALLFVGAFTKSAQVPFHFWLPGAMAAPAPVSAYLHSATMVKAGVLLIARLFPIFADSPLWLPVLTTVGLTSFVVAGWNALWNDDVKKLLAYSTIAYLGLLVAHYGYATRAGLRGELLVIANHALYKSALFLLVGWVEKATGTRDLRTLAREHWPPHEPVGVALFGLGALALAGSPLLLGFVGKELFLETVLARSPGRITPQIVVVVVAGALSVAYALKIFMAMLFGSETPPPGRGVDRRSISPWLLGIPALLLAPQVLGGLAPRLLFQPFAREGMDLPSGPAFWHHADRLLVISLLSFGMGGLLFLVWRRLLRVHHFALSEPAVAALAHGGLRLARWTGRILQAGGHPRFGAALVGIAGGAVLVALHAAGLRGLPLRHWGPEPLLGWVPGFVCAGGAVLTLGLAGRVPKAIALALVGYGVAFYYVLFRAPDLLLTQILVETISLVLLLVVFRRLPPLARDARSPLIKAGHAALALAFGAVVTTLAWTAAGSGPATRTGDAHLAASLPLAHGRNVVNVILVDFRGADTLGEIVVLAIAAFGVLAISRKARPAPGGAP